jgi:hypothetical protein
VTEVRPFSPDDLRAVHGLIEARLPGWLYGPALLAETLLEHPWADPELPSLVAVDDAGQVVGFVGRQVRRMRLGDRRLRGVCCSHLVIADDPRAGLTGTLLLREMLSGPQDLSWTDSATATVGRMWEAFGGYLDHARSADWMLVLRPARWLAAALSEGLRERQLSRSVVPVAAFPAQAAGRHVVRRAFHPRNPGVRGRDAEPGAIAVALPSLSNGVSLRVEYDGPQLESLFGQVASVLGPLVTRLVIRGQDPIGWYAYLSRPGGASRVLHLGAAPGEADAVLSELLDHAGAAGSAVVAGRAEPHLRQALARRFAVLGYARRPVVHTRDLEVRAVLATEASLLSHLDGEWFAT